MQQVKYSLSIDAHLASNSEQFQILIFERSCREPGDFANARRERRPIAGDIVGIFHDLNITQAHARLCRRQLSDPAWLAPLDARFVRRCFC